jgi:hypothetical protein
MTLIAQMSRAFLLTALALCALVACTPQYNWRVVPNPDLGYMATFPDKPAMVTRTLDLIGLQVPLTFHAAQVDGLYFAVGTVPLQADLQPRSLELRDALAQAVANNIAASRPELKPLTWLGKSAVEMNSVGTLPGGKAGFAQARFFEHRGVLYEVLIMGPGAAADPNMVTSWFGGFSLMGQ